MLRFSFQTSVFVILITRQEYETVDSSGLRVIFWQKREITLHLKLY